MHQIARIEFRNAKFPYARGALPPCNPRFSHQLYSTPGGSNPGSAGDKSCDVPCSSAAILIGTIILYWLVIFRNARTKCAYLIMLCDVIAKFIYTGLPLLCIRIIILCPLPSVTSSLRAVP